MSTNYPPYSPLDLSVIWEEDVTVVDAEVVDELVDTVQDITIDDIMDIDVASPAISKLVEKRYEKYQLSAKQRAFLTAYVHLGGNVTGAARSVGCTIWAHYNWLDECPNYKSAFTQAKPLADNTLLVTAIKRATQGWDEPHFYQDAVVGHVRKFSDTLLLALLKAKFPNEFKDRSETTVNASLEAVRKLDPGVDRLPQDKLEALIELADKSAAMKRIKS